MFHIAGVAAWTADAETELADDRLPRALAGAGGVVTHSERAPGGLLGVVSHGARDGLAAQVRADRDAKIATVASCRFDDRDELCRALGLSDGANDASVCLAAYRRWGESFPARCKGDFAGIVWDWGQRRLFGFRDQLGVRPLFYASRAGAIAVASDVELLLSIVGSAGQPDDRSIVEYLTWQFHSVDRTFWDGARRLPAGHVLEVAGGESRVRAYWRPPDEVAVEPKQALERFRELFFQSVRRRLAADGSVLAHLSGGIDSSSIVCVADRVRRAEPDRFPPVRTVSARYPGLDTDEGPYIDAVTRSVSLPHESWDGRNKPLRDLSDPSPAGPGCRSHRADGSADEFDIAQRFGATAILSGQGGDQVGAPSGLSEHLARARPLWFGWRILSPRGLPSRERLRRAKFLARSWAPDAMTSWWIRRRVSRDPPPWLEPRWRDVLGDGARRDDRSHGAFASLVQEAHWRDLMGGAMGQALDADHRVATRHAVEMRYPYLDHDLVSFVLALPPRAWPLPDPYARLHRTALADLLPPVVLGRTTKAMFSPVVATQMRGMAPDLRALLFQGPWASARWVSRRGAQSLFDRAISATRENDWADWQAVRAIATLEAWLRKVLGYDARTKD